MIIDHNLLNTIAAKAANSARKRMNYNFHKTSDDLLQRMLNILHPGSYVHPHKHQTPDKREAFIILKGRLLVVLFDDNGAETNRYILNRDDEVFGIEIPPRTYHTIVALEKDTCVYEVKDGPYDPEDDKYFAPWAPTEDNTNDANAYLNNLMQP